MKIAIVSGKGGSGKSTVTASFVELAGRHIGNCIAIDCDVDASNLPLLFEHKVKYTERFVSGQIIDLDAEACVGCGKCTSACAYGAIKLTSEDKTKRKVAKIDSLLCEGCGLCEKICPTNAIRLQDDPASTIMQSDFLYGKLIHGRLKPGDDNSGKMIARLREIADSYSKDSKTNKSVVQLVQSAQKIAEENDLQILDGPPGIGCPALSTVTGMDKVIIVTEPTLSGLSDMKRMYQVATSYCKDIYVIINKADVNLENCKIIRKFCQEHNLKLAGELPFDKQTVEAQLNRQTIINYAPDSEIAKKLILIFNLIFF